MAKWIPAEVWSEFSEGSHFAIFNEYKDHKRETIQKAILALNPKDDPVGYVTTIEMDAGTIYWQYGGIFNDFRNRDFGEAVVNTGLNLCRQQYDRVTFRVENTNAAMIKTALKCGFLIDGVRIFNQKTYLEHTLEFK